jgi:hypothetical protein
MVFEDWAWYHSRMALRSWASKDVASAYKVFGLSFHPFPRLSAHQMPRLLSVFDKKEPTTAGTTTCENARKCRMGILEFQRALGAISNRSGHPVVTG